MPCGCALGVEVTSGLYPCALDKVWVLPVTWEVGSHRLLMEGKGRSDVREKSEHREKVNSYSKGQLPPIRIQQE